jgi:hypothetical protein
MTNSQKTTMYQQIEKHGNDLNRIFNTGLDAITLCKKLHSLEKKANKLATDWCNGVINSENIDSHINPILNKVYSILGSNPVVPIQFNGDARGYALKISDKVVRENNLQIYTDWGGYGIIAPDFTPNN